MIERPGAKTFLIAPDAEKGCSALAYFRAGQYISVALDIGEARLCKPYTIACGPKAAMGETGNTYALTVKESAGGFGSAYILNNWVQGTEVLFSAPLGDFYYNSLRDAKNVIAIAGGSGITPFLSMAAALPTGSLTGYIPVLLIPSAILRSRFSPCWSADPLSSIVKQHRANYRPVLLYFA